MVRRVIVACIALVAALVWARAARRGIAARREKRHPDLPEPDAWPRVWVIVPAWRERGTVELCVRGLQQLDYPDFGAVILAGGPDGTYEAALRASGNDERLHVVEQMPRGKNAALNEGLRLGHGEVIVILDADSQVPKDWLRKLVKPIVYGAEAATGNYLPLRRTPVALQGEMEKIDAYLIRGASTLQGSGGIALRRDVIDLFGGFSENVRVGVDWDLDVQVANRGLSRAFCPDAILYTERPATLAEWWTNELRWQRAYLASIFRHRSYFFSSPKWLFTSLYGTVVAWVAVLLAGSSALAVVTGARAFALGSRQLLLALVLYQFLRRTGLVVEVVAYTGRLEWLRTLPVMPLLLFGRLVASCVACLTMGRNSMHFKGPRHQLDLECPVESGSVPRAETVESPGDTVTV